MVGLPRASVVIVGFCLAACGAKDSGTTASGADSGLGSSGNATGSEEASTVADSTAESGVLDLPGGEETATASDEGGTGCAGNPPTPDATLTGTVYAPNLEIPISGALVYLTSEPVEPVPDGVYCAECVTLACDTEFVLTAADGSFSLPAVSGSVQQLVVQKGQFLHVVDYDVAPGVNTVVPTDANLPGEWNPAAGMWIPRIAVYDGYPDYVYNVLAKFGMGDVDASGTLINGTESFTLIDDTSDQGAFMDDVANLNQYHIVFLPCASTKYWTGAPTVDAARIQNIRDYVEAGGKWYATDHSNEYIAEPFPSYQDFHSPGMPDIQPAYTSVGNVVDPELLAWLSALPPALKDIGNGNQTLNQLPSVTTELSYSGIDAIHDVIVQDDQGNDVNVGHQTWVEGPCASCSDAISVRPMAISGQYGCGRMMYSTFETSSVAHSGLNPQELVLLYMILEIGVCFEDTPPPPPID